MFVNLNFLIYRVPLFKYTNIFCRTCCHRNIIIDINEITLFIKLFLVYNRTNEICNNQLNCKGFKLETL